MSITPCHVWSFAGCHVHGGHPSLDIWTTIHPNTVALVLDGSFPLNASPALWPTHLSLIAQPGVVDQLFRALLALAALVFLAVEGALIYAVFRFRHKEDNQSGPEISPRPGLEIVWTLIPAVLVIVIAVFSLRVLAAPSTGYLAGDDSAVGQDTAEAGRVVFMTYGCSACHSLKAVGAKGTVGPSLNGVGSWAGTTVAGMDAEAFLHQAILDPEAHIAVGYQSGIMPTNFSTRLSPAQLSGLVKFLMAQK